MNARAKFYWSVRRELWEHRSIWIAPLAVAALVLLGFLYNLRSWSAAMLTLSTLTAAKQLYAVTLPYSLAASVIMLSGLLAACFYCLDALNSERRDRTVLFWKSMPVSDTTTVLAKVFIPLVGWPVVAYGIALATHFVMLLITSIALAGSGIGASTQWDVLPLGQMAIVMVYGLSVHALWFAPMFGYLLIVSMLAKRAPLVWAILPLVAISFVERLAFGTSAFFSLIQYRIVGAMGEAFTAGAMKGPITQLSQLDPVRFLSSPNLWMGLAFAAICIVAAIRLRRYREPI